MTHMMKEEGTEDIIIMTDTKEEIQMGLFEIIQPTPGPNEITAPIMVHGMANKDAAKLALKSNAQESQHKVLSTYLIILKIKEVA
jgi:hypothetical protein